MSTGSADQTQVHSFADTILSI